MASDDIGVMEDEDDEMIFASVFVVVVVAVVVVVDITVSSWSPRGDGQANVNDRCTS
jgi:hypothetical protein